MAKSFQYSKSPLKLSINHIELKTNLKPYPIKRSKNNTRNLKNKKTQNSFSLNSSSRNSAEKNLNLMITSSGPFKKKIITNFTKNNIISENHKIPKGSSKEIIIEDRFTVNSVFEDIPLQLKINRPMSAVKYSKHNKNPKRNVLFYDRVARFINGTQTPFT